MGHGPSFIRPISIIQGENGQKRSYCASIDGPQRKNLRVRDIKLQFCLQHNLTQLLFCRNYAFPLTWLDLLCEEFSGELCARGLDRTSFKTFLEEHYAPSLIDMHTNDVDYDKVTVNRYLQKLASYYQANKTFSEVGNGYFDYFIGPL